MMKITVVSDESYTLGFSTDSLTLEEGSTKHRHAEHDDGSHHYDENDEQQPS